LIESLQRDIAHLREHVDEGRREAAEHRRQIDALIEQLHEVRSRLEPILSEREAAIKSRRDLMWSWASKGGWVLMAAIGYAVWHYVTRHLGIRND